MDIYVYDNVFSDEENDKLYNDILYNNSFTYGERDNPSTPVSGLVFNFENGPFYDVAIKANSNLSNLKLQRSYVNLFLPKEIPYFHIDGEQVVTCLFYLSPQYDLDEGGETQLFFDNKILGVQSKPKRLVVFDGAIKHRATSFRSYPRITVALKFLKS